MQEKKISVKRKIKKFNDIKLGKQDKAAFVASCLNYSSNSKDYSEKIHIKKSAKLPALDLNIKQLILPDDLSVKISPVEIAALFKQIVNITRDPLTVASYLKVVEEELSVELAENGVKLDSNSLPDHLIPSLGHLIPGAPKDDYEPKIKGRLLNKVLLKTETKWGVNKDGYARKFVDAVEAEPANQTVSKYGVFTENTDITRLLFHGSYSHRLMLRIFIEAVKKGKINLKLKSGVTISILQLLEILVNVKYSRPNKLPTTLWEMSFDTTADTAEVSFFHPFDVKSYKYSCRSPFVLNSLLLCFGADLALPNLQLYLLDSFYKSMYKMILRTIKAIDKTDIPNNVIYFTCINYLSTMDRFAFGAIGSDCFFMLTQEEAMRNPNYVILDKGIVKRKADTKIGTYTNWSTFLNAKAIPLSIMKNTFEKESEVPAISI